MLKNRNEHPLDYIQSLLCRHVSRFDCILFLGMFAASLLVHLYIFTHKFINHDDIGALYSDGSYAIYSGRWLIKPITKLTGSISIPWFDGVISALFLAAAVVLIIRIFRIHRYIPALLMGGCLIAFPVIASTFTYMFSAVPYMFALLFAVIGASLIRTERIPCMVAGAVAIALAMGCYQAYFCLAVILLITVVGLDLLDDRFGGSWKRIFFTGVKYVVALVAAMVLYYVILKLSLHISGVELVSYQGIDAMGQVGLSQLLRRVVDAYKGFVKFCSNSSGVFHGIFVALVVAAALLTAAGAVLEVRNKKLWRSPATMFFLVVVALLFPLGCGLVYVMVDSTVSAVHWIMLYPMVMVLVLPSIVLDRLTVSVSDGKGLKKQLCALFAVVLIVLQAAIGYECVLVTNRAYFTMDVTYENAYAFYTKLAAKLELQEGYTPNSPVAFIGRAQINTYAPNTNITGVLNGDSALNIYTIPQYLRYFLASDYTFVSEQREAELSKTTEFQEMPIYPAAGSIRTIDGVIVVRFS